MVKSVRKFIFGVFAFLFLANILAWIAVFNLSRPGFLKVSFFDVGQGDAIFIETPVGHKILIDGGPGSVISEKLGEKIPYWDRTIDLIILTHPHSDHIKGLIDVLEKYRVENILCTGVDYDSTLYNQWQSMIEETEAQIHIAKKGQRIISSLAVIEILYPLESFEDEEIKNLDNTSVIAQLIFNENSFLFTGDAYQEVELILIEEFGDGLKSNVLKVGHHGSRTSTGKEFLEQVLPEIAVISVGENNSYGHPHQEVLEIFNKYDINILRTDIDGDINIISDGNYLEIKK